MFVFIFIYIYVNFRRWFIYIYLYMLKEILLIKSSANCFYELHNDLLVSLPSSKS